MPFSTGHGVSPRARIGLIALASEYTLDHEAREVLADVPGVGFYTTRISNDPVITPASLGAMEAGLTAAAATLLPGDRLDVIAYGCTSASMIIGPDRVAERIRASKPAVDVVTPISAAVAGMGALGMRRIGVLTPYTADVNQGIADHLGAASFGIDVFGSFDEPDDRVVSAIDEASLTAALRGLCGSRGLDGVFVSCTSIRLLNCIAEIEADLGIPVVSSNQALLWHALRRAGVADTPRTFGRLFEHPG